MFVVVGQEIEWDDSRCWLVIAFRTKKKAVETTSLLNGLLFRLREANVEEERQIIHEVSEIDSNVGGTRRGMLSTEYEMWEVELEDAD